MNSRRRLGGILMVLGVGAVLLGAAGAAFNLGGPPANGASPAPTTSAAGPTTLPTSSEAPGPSAAPTLAPATPAPTTDTPGLVQAFVAELQGAIRAGKQGPMAARLAPSVIDRYGRPACDAYLTGRAPNPAETFEVLAVHDPAPWAYVTDGRTTTVPDTLTLEAKVTGPDPSGVVTTETRELHLELLDGVLYWFTDCGTPLA